MLQLTQFNDICSLKVSKFTQSFLTSKLNFLSFYYHLHFVQLTSMSLSHVNFRKFWDVLEDRQFE